MIQLYHGDCLVEMSKIADGSVDMILGDLPYGTTACKWDNVIPFEPLWAHYWRVLKPNGAVVLFGSEPFSSYLRMSQIKHYKYDWVWDKKHHTNFALAKKQPLKIHETISVFCMGKCSYYPQKTKGKLNHKHGTKYKRASEFVSNIGIGNDDYSGLKYPKSIVEFEKHSSQSNHHQAQKPVALLEYLIKTYTIEGETVLDNTMGSGSTGVACVNTGRNFIGVEMDDKYFEIAKNRIEERKKEENNNESF
jgi:site-specific DNA-methyltransferase (adenine-specific)